MKKNCFATFALALSALVLPLVSPAVGTKGDIYSITPLYESDKNRVFKPGETIKFRVRLLASDWDTTKPSAWVVRYVGLSSETLAEAQHPPQIGLVVSGRLCMAKIESDDNYVVSKTDDAAYVFTDLICAYTVQSGDFAWPALLALAGSEEKNPLTPGDPDAPNSYFVNNDSLWQYQNATTGDPCQFFYMDPMDANRAWDAWSNKTKPAVDKQVVDKDLTKANFLVRGVDFDRDSTHEEKAQDGSTHWRVVRQGKESVKGTPAPIVTSGPPQESVTLYVWSENEDVVRMAGDAAKVNFPTNREGTLTVERWVTTITTEQGKSDYALAFEGKQQGKSATIVMSPVFGYDFDQGGKRVNYITTQIYCDEPEKPNAQISFSETSTTKQMTVDTSMEGVDTLKNSAIPVYITLSEPSPDPVEVWLVISNKTNVACDPITNQNIAVSQYDYFTDSEVAYTNFTFDAYQTTAKVYVYPIGGTDDTQDKGIDIGLNLDAAAAAHYKENIVPLNLKIRKSNHKPVIVSPATGADYDAQEADGFTVPIQVADCYRDLQNRPFTVTVSYSDTSLMTTNVYFREGIETSVRLEKYGVNATYANITVTDPVGNVSTPPVKVYFTVKPQKTITAALYDNDTEDSLHVGTVFKEGDKPIVRFTLSEKLTVGAHRYAFLVPQDEASSNLVECAAFTEGVQIPGGRTNSDLLQQFSLKLKDGCDDTEKRTLQYRIVLRTGDTLDSEADTSFADVAGLQFTVQNVYPKLKKVTVNNSANGVTAGQTYSIPVPCDADVPFGCMASDVSSIDMDAGLRTLWCFTEGRTSGTWKFAIVTSTVERTTCFHRFTYPSVTQEVQVVTLDKDMFDTNLTYVTQTQLAELWDTATDIVEPFVFRVGVSMKPAVKVITYGFANTESGEAMYESGTGANGAKPKISVELSEATAEPRRVRLIAKPAADENWGTLEFDTATHPVDESDPSAGVYTDLTIDADKVEPNSSSSYVLGQGLKFKYSTLNGTAGSEDKGWEIKAEVLMENDEGEWVRDPYYAISEGTMISVINVAPTISPKQPAEGEPITTNKTVSIGKAFDIVWTPGDVLADLKATWPGTANKGLKCEWYIKDVYQAGKTTYVTNTTGTAKVAQQTTSITLNDEGLIEVKLVITDLDDGVTERTWYFYIAPTKKLTVTPVGPAGNSKTRYLGAGGLGKGRVWTNGGSPVLAAFSQTWAYNVTTRESEVHAFGYPSAAEKYPDDGTLGPGGRDVAIDPNGESAESGMAADKYYNYDGEYDNYFYRWAYILPSESGGAPTVEYGILQPTSKADTDTMEPVILDEYDAEKVSYLTRRVEAVFSREKLKSDNLGDINADGIPDLYLTLYVGLGVAESDGTVTGDDLADLGGFNGDGDYLPNTMTAQYAAFVPNLSNTWVRAGRAFTAKMELRGADDNFNDGPSAQWLVAVNGKQVPNPAYIPGVAPDKCYCDPHLVATSTVSFLEYVAFTNWCGRQATPLDPENKSSWELWSPERPTDPTEADTDSDGLPDGYEYYFWYKAHVGYFGTDGDAATYARLTGRRYNPADPCHPVVISSDDIESKYDPIGENKELSEADTDNDGLPDLVEFEIGTNPFDYDTDGDGLPDGYEVAISKTDPLKYATDNIHADGTINPDGDQMAFFEVGMVRVTYEVLDGAGAVTGTNTLWAFADEVDYDVLAKRLRKPVSLYGTWQYNAGGALALGRCVFDATDAAAAWAVVELPVIEYDDDPEAVWLMHFQVYAFEGFDPRTAWTSSPPIKRNTEGFTIYDEFMLMAFFVQTGGLTEANVTPNPNRSLVAIWTDYSTNPLSPDTDGDIMPDGWELYVMGGPDVSDGLPPGNGYSPLVKLPDPIDFRDYDRDGLTWPEEFSGVQSSAVHGFAVSHPNWRNKNWPTDPWNPDTDGDGMLDGVEGGVVNELVNAPVDLFEASVVRNCFLYNNAGKAGGGLDPLSVDTDLDGLPDPWETQFHGTYTAGSTSVAEDKQTFDGQTNVTETVINAAVTWNMDGMDGTVSDARLDYDSDGLANWQEYMVGAMRCWRYDDSESRWGVNAVSKSQILGLTPNSDEWNEFWTKTLVDREGADFNPHLVNGSFDGGQSYMTLCRNEFDPAYGTYYMFRDGIGHDLLTEGPNNRFFNRAMFEIWAGGACPYSLSASYPLQYISCDPRESDSDHDGMDDYYELFHGMNPLLGAPGVQCYDANGIAQPCDIVFNAYLNPPEVYTLNYQGTVITALNNWWRNADTRHGPEEHVKNFETSYDFIAYPWLNGIAGADPDGDNIVNQEEAIMPNVQAASTYFHTDPTPLWMTDTSYTNSLTRRYYRLFTQPYDEDCSSFDMELDNDEFVDADGVTRHLGDFDGFTWIPSPLGGGDLSFSYGINYWMVADGWAFSFEENEGYDSDHDFLGDFEEGQGRTKNASDPQDSDDPLRRQAMYFNGVDAFLQTPLAVAERVMNIRGASEERQNFLYYTVECWAKADAEGIADASRLQTLVERAIWTDPANAADERYLRKNFLIGIKNGRWYTRFDTTGTDVEKYVDITDGPAATAEWTHLAATFDGKALRLYVNGVCYNIRETSVHPEHGVSALAVDAAGEMNPAGGTVTNGNYVSILVGASAKTQHGIVYDWAWRGRNYANVTPENPLGLAPQTTFADYESFYRGYVDEVRIWDGARSEEEILSDYKNRARYTTKEILANRQAVWTKWNLGGLRSPASVEQLPAQLMYHFSFDHLTGAVLPEDVCKVPAGFDTVKTAKDAAARWSRPDEWKEERWANSAVRSTVYTDAAWVPWINNTVAHLPRFDGTTLDSFYWSDDYAGDRTASSYGYNMFVFPRTHEVFSRWVQLHYVDDLYYDSHYDPDFSIWNGHVPLGLAPSGIWATTSSFIQKTRYDALVQYQDGLRASDSTNDVAAARARYEAVQRFRFAARDRNTVGDDLLPMGGAYPRRISSAEGGMWDDGSAADAWAQTGRDSDNNGLPDWWEEYARANYAEGLPPRDPLTWDTTVLYRGLRIPAWEAYLRDLARGLVKIGNEVREDGNYADTRDSDKDGVIDFYAEAYNLADGHAGEDDDGDGLSNYAEYLITEVFKYAKCDPKQYATDRKTCDYFLKVGELYLGEIFTDHDQMNDIWEARYDVDYVNRGVFDPFADHDGDGWSNYAEFRAGTDPTTKDTLSIDGYVCPEYPVPAIAANIIYNGETVIRHPLVVKAWNETTDYDMTKAPDAMWTLGAAESTASQDGGVQSSANTQGSALQQHEKFLGRKPAGEETFYLSGGHVSEGSVKLLYLDKGYSFIQYDPNTGLPVSAASGRPEEAKWYYFIVDKGGKLVRAGGSLFAAMGEEEVVVGTIDYVTGRVTIDFGHEALCGEHKFDPSLAEMGDDEKENTTDTTSGNTLVVVNYDASYWRVQWQASSVRAMGEGLHYLSDSDPVADTALSFGHLREGKNTFVCFVDEDGNGEYTAGELFGVVRGVDVGWSGASFDLELTQTHPIFARCDLTGNNDRSVWYGVDSGNLSTDVNDAAAGETTGTTGGEGETLSNGGKKMHVRVDRYAINGMKIGLDTQKELLIQYNRVLFDKWLSVGARTYLHEGDFMNEKNDEFDIDWAHFNEIGDDAAVRLKFGGEVQSVSYRVVIDNSDFVHPTASNKVLSVAFTRVFDNSNARTKATDLTLDPAGIVYGARPTFKWSMKMAGGKVNNTYTAFKIRVYETNGTTVVYQSPMTFVPPMDDKGYYVWKAPFSVGDQTSLGEVFGRAGNYKWSVSMYNAKFQTDAYCEPVAFSTAVSAQQLTDDHGYGAVKVAVKYAGPTNVLSKAGDTLTTAGMVRVQAFANADFAGVPESQAFTTNVVAITNTTDLTANATLYGLKAGTYYIRAYIDTDGDFVKDDWESWGCAKASVTVVSGRMPETATVWIEDADTDGDWIPDAYEYEKNGNLTTENAMVDPNGKIILKTATYEVVKNGYASISSSLPGASLTLFENLDAAKLLLGLGADTTTSTIDAIREAIATRINPGSVKITQLSMNAPMNMVTMSVAASAQEPPTASFYSAVYSVPDATTVTIEVYHAESLDGEWKLVDTKQVLVNSALDATFEIPVDVNSTTGYYRVVVVE